MVPGIVVEGNLEQFQISTFFWECRYRTGYLSNISDDPLLPTQTLRRESPFQPVGEKLTANKETLVPDTYEHQETRVVYNEKVLLRSVWLPWIVRDNRNLPRFEKGTAIGVWFKVVRWGLCAPNIISAVLRKASVAPIIKTRVGPAFCVPGRPMR